MLIRSRPTSFNLGRSLAKFMPLVVTAMVFRPSNFLSSAAEEHGARKTGEKRESEKTVTLKYLHQCRPGVTAACN